MTTVSKRDYYEVLGVGPGSRCGRDQDGLPRSRCGSTRTRTPATTRPKSASRRPPRPSRSSANPEKRARYDRFGHEGLNGQPGFADIGDIFSAFGDILGNDLFGSLFGGRASPAAAQVRVAAPRSRCNST